jgi:hypothetical protein
MRARPKAACGAIILLLAALSSTSAGHAAGATVHIGSVTGRPAQEVTARLEVLGVPAPGLGAFTIDIAYDADVVSPVSCQADPARALDNAVCNPTYKARVVRVVGFHMTDGLVGDTPLADVTFRLSGHEGDCSSLSISIVELTDPSAAVLTSVRIENGSICIGDAAAPLSTPAPGAQMTPEAASEPGQPGSADVTNGEQQPSGTSATAVTGGTVEGGQPAGSTPALAAASASTATANARATARATPGSANRTQSDDGDSGGGNNRWLIIAGAVIATGAVAGTGAVIWKRRASPGQ